MAKCALTVSAVKAAKPAAKDDFLWDSDVAGFGMKVTPTGKKVFLLRYRMPGRTTPQTYTIGNFPELLPNEAREIAKSVKHHIRTDGIDPQRQKILRRREASELAFEIVAEEFIEKRLKADWKAWSVPAGLLRRRVIPRFRGIPLNKITRADIAEVIDDLAGLKAARRNCFAALRLLFNWAFDSGIIDKSPMPLKPPPAPAPRDRALTQEEATCLWLAAEELGYPFGPWAKLLLATAGRRTECAKLGWHEVDREGRLWVLPAARAKNTLVTDIPLNDLALAVLDDVMREQSGAGTVANVLRWPRKGFVFTTTGLTPISGFSKVKRRLDDKMLEVLRRRATERGENPDHCQIAPWRFHDMRRTIATHLQKEGFPIEVTEAVLNHKSGVRSGLSRVYNLHKYFEEKRAALSVWGELLTRWVEAASPVGAAEAASASVIPLRQAS